MAQTNESKKKQRAGMILSSILRDIAEEKTEMVTIDGEDRMVTKAQALARMAFKHALGYTEQKVVEGNLVDIVHGPDRVYVAMVWDRLEGRVAAVEPGKKEQRTISDRVGEQSKKRINKMSEGFTK